MSEPDLDKLSQKALDAYSWTLLFRNRHMTSMAIRDYIIDNYSLETYRELLDATLVK